MSEELKPLVVHSAVYKTEWTKKFENRKKWQAPDPNLIHSFIPGTIIEIRIEEGQEVKEGECLLILEAMKMRNRVEMPVDGVIKKIHIKPGQQIPKAHLMLEIEQK
ncbi:acetyl-CoA carboxylase biotin carboxyl carrier protein subunit [Puteibacter caeruleilacunae]|nr:acetyl-CoA carboxylase biotin carboxyl carrier protein subunit [Puteibacter caeruleilacunae]